VSFLERSNASADQQQPTGCDTTSPSSGSSEVVASTATGGKTWLQEGSTAWRALQHCKTPEGASIHECAEALGLKVHTVNNRMADLLRRGYLWRAGIDRFSQRYFSSEAARDAWAAAELPKLVAERRDMKRAQWRADDQRKRNLRALGLMPPCHERQKKSIRDTLVEMASCEQGASRKEMAEKIGGADGSRPEKCISMHLFVLVRDGRLNRGGPAMTIDSRYFADPAHAAAYTQRFADGLVQPKRPKPKPPSKRYQVVQPKASVPASVTIKSSTTKAWANATPIIPPHVKVQVVPGYRGHPVFADPSLAGRGEISRDWMDRRLKGVQHG
jgi:DNA-binding Lrp family transcriptional regulator